MSSTKGLNTSLLYLFHRYVYSVARLSKISYPVQQTHFDKCRHQPAKLSDACTIRTILYHYDVFDNKVLLLLMLLQQLSSLLLAIYKICNLTWTHSKPTHLYGGWRHSKQHTCMDEDNQNQPPVWWIKTLKTTQLYGWKQSKPTHLYGGWRQSKPTHLYAAWNRRHSPAVHLQNAFSSTAYI